MGCGASRDHGTPRNLTIERLPSEGKPLGEWDSEEVSAWYSSLVPDLQKYKASLLPDEGCVVAQWTEQYLTSRGVTTHDAMRLIAYRNKALARASVHVRQSNGTAVQSPPPDAIATAALQAPSGSEVVLGVPSGSTTNRTTAVIHFTQTVVATNGQPPLSGNSSSTADSRRESLTALLTKGVRLARNGIRSLGPSLPFPGAEAANLVVILLDLVDGAIANHANLSELRQRAVAFLDILGAYQEELSNLRPPRYKGVVGDFQELLQGIIAYTKEYCERNCIARLLTSGSDKEQYQQLAASLGALSEQVVMVLVAADSNARLQHLQRSVEDATGLLARAAAYRDPAAGARALVDELGGLDSVLADDDKLRRVQDKLDVGSRVTIKVVESLLLSHLDRGPQRLIRHPDLRLFWMHQYATITEVPWFDFWEQFPEKLRENPADPETVTGLSRMLGKEAARSAFERAVERGNKDCISVWELKLAFTGDEGLVPQVERLLTTSRSQLAQAAAGSASGKPSHGPPAGAGGGSAAAAAVGAASGGGGRCQLPPLVANYTGRDDEAIAMVGQLQTHGSVALLAPGGMGKSCLAVDVGWRLMRSGAAAGGALWVDLREARSVAEVEARFCASLGLQAEKQDNAPRILAALKAAAAAVTPEAVAGAPARDDHAPAGSGLRLQHYELGGPADGSLAASFLPSPLLPPPMRMLVVVDNAEDALLCPGAADSIRGLLTKILKEVPSVRLLVTSRVTLGLGAAGLAERPVGAIAATAATKLIQSVAEDLLEGEAARVAAACQCVPLLLCLVAEALVAGRLTLEDLSKLQATSSSAATATSNPVDSTGTTVRLVLGSLKRQHQQAAAQLAVFPSAFDDEAAAAVLGLAVPQTRAMLAVLHRYSVVQRSTGPQSYVMHMVVRRQSVAQGRLFDPGLQASVEGRFVGWMGALLREWSAMYRSAREWRLAMTMAREHQADVSKLFELLAAGVDEGTGAAASSPASAAGSCWDPAVVAAGLTDELRQMLEGLGLLGRMEVPCCALLKRLGVVEAPYPASASATASASACTLTLPGTGSGGDDGGGGFAIAAAPTPSPSLAHPLPVASILFMRAWVRVRGGRMYKEAEEDARRSWEVREAALGPEHPDTVTALYILAAALGYLRRYGEAETLNRQVLSVQLRLVGELHADTAYSINGLAVCVDKQGRFAEAESLYRRALDIRRQALGDRHPATAGSLNNLAGSIYGQGRRSEAEGLYHQALELRRQVLGEEHPDTIATLANLSACTVDQGRMTEAEPLLRQTWELRKRVLGEDHPDTVQSLTSLAACLDEMDGRDAEAEGLHWQAVRVSVRMLGRGHPTTKSRLARLGDCLEARGAAFDVEVVLDGLEALGA